MGRKEYELLFQLRAALDSSVSSSFGLVNKKLSELKENLKGLDKNSAEYNSIAKKMQEIYKVESAQKKVTAAISKTKAEIAKTVIGIGAVATAIYAGPVTAAMDLESSFADVAKVVDGLRTNTGKFTSEYYNTKNAVMDMSYTSLPMTTGDISTLAATAGQSGISNNEVLPFVEYAGKMGIAFDVSAEQAGDWMAKWRTAFKMSQSEVVELADKINYLGNTTAARADQISGVVTRVGSFGEIAGLSSGDISAIAATMVGVGVQEETAATGIKNMIKALTRGDSMTDRQRSSMIQLGLNPVQLSKDMQTDAQGTIFKFIEKVSKIPEYLQTPLLTDFFGSESIAAISPILTITDTLKDNFNKVGDASSYAGSMQMEYAVRSDTTANKIQLLKNGISAVSATIGEAYLPMVKQGAEQLLEWIKPTIEWIRKNPETIRTISVTAASLVGLKLGFLGLKLGINEVKVAWLTMKAIFLGIKSPAGIAAAAIGIVAVALLAAYKHAKDLEKADLERRFGNISLSMEEIQYVAEKIVNTKSMEKVTAALEKFTALDGAFEEIAQYRDKLQELNWQVSIGIDLDESQRDTYLSSVESYVSQLQQQVKSRGYAVELGLRAILMDSDYSAYLNASSSSSKITNAMNEELTSLGKELSDVFTKAFEDDLFDFDEMQKAAEIQAKIAKIENFLNSSKNESAWALLQQKFSGESLNADSFKQLATEMQKLVEQSNLNVDDTYKSTWQTLNQNWNYALSRNAENPTEENQKLLNESQKAFVEFDKNGYDELKTQNTIKVAQFQIETLKNAFPEVTAILDNMNSVAGEYYNGSDSGQAIWDNIATYAGGQFGMLPSATQRNVENLLKFNAENIPILEQQIESYKQKNEEIPPELLEIVQSYNGLMMLTKSTMPKGRKVAKGRYIDGAYVGNGSILNYGDEYLSKYSDTFGDMQNNVQLSDVSDKVVNSNNTVTIENNPVFNITGATSEELLAKVENTLDINIKQIEQKSWDWFMNGYKNEKRTVFN